MIQSASSNSESCAKAGCKVDVRDGLVIEEDESDEVLEEEDVLEEEEDVLEEDEDEVDEFEEPLSPRCS
jgi:hypothetical protein